MTRTRVRLRFRKEGDLRLISHRDLARTFERWFRRAALPLRMSQGFHPHPRLTFPLALPVGIVGLDEVMEVELAEGAPTAAEIERRLVACAPSGLAVTHVECLPPGAAKLRLARVHYELALPAGCVEQVGPRIEQFLAAREWPVPRDGGRPAIDVRPDVEQIELRDETLRLVLHVRPQGGAQCRDVLRALGLERLEAQGTCIVRTRVELATARSDEGSSPRRDTSTPAPPTEHATCSQPHGAD